MKIDELIKKRFTELEAGAKSLLQPVGQAAYGEGALYDSQKFSAWTTSVTSLLQRIFGEDSSHYQVFNRSSNVDNTAKYILEGQAKQCVGIFHAAKEDFEGGYLFNARTLIQAEVLADAIEQAEVFMASNYKDAACIAAGVALETAIRELCNKNSIAHGKLDLMNSELCKANVYNTAMQKQVTAWADLRNRAAHGKWNEYTKEQVQALISGVTLFIATCMN